jgi:hypothetical protein
MSGREVSDLLVGIVTRNCWTGLLDVEKMIEWCVKKSRWCMLIETEVKVERQLKELPSSRDHPAVVQASLAPSGMMQSAGRNA